MIAVMVGVENVFHRLGGDALAIGEGGARATRIVGVDYEQVVFHLDDDVVAVALVHITLAEPDARSNVFHLIGFGLRPRRKKCGSGEHGKSGNQNGTTLHSVPPRFSSSAVYPICRTSARPSELFAHR